MLHKEDGSSMSGPVVMVLTTNAGVLNSSLTLSVQPPILSALPESKDEGVHSDRSDPDRCNMDEEMMAVECVSKTPWPHHD